jgi:hypothetical protein
LLVLKSKKVFFMVSEKIFGAGAGAGSAIPIYGSAEPESEPKEIFSAPQH